MGDVVSWLLGTKKQSCPRLMPFGLPHSCPLFPSSCQNSLKAWERTLFKSGLKDSGLRGILILQLLREGG